MRIDHQKKEPAIHPSAWIASTALINGDVIIEEEVYISYGSVIIAEGAPIHIKRGTIVMENVVIKSSEGKTFSNALIIEEDVLIGPHAYLIGCTVEKNCFLAAGAKVYNQAHIGAQSIIEINGVVHIDTYLKPQTRVPTQHTAFGNPAKIYPPDDTGKIAKETESLNLLNLLFQLTDNSKDLKYIAALENYRHILFKHKNDDIMKNFSSKLTDTWQWEKGFKVGKSVGG
ncbi:gamma carbonic anhydrase family protein [Bacillus megaterium]|uniref:gamma carbonic anhydrase family protein n=1 Tax=Priestia megaterium TaxID=1404 RepID=UPI001293620A|nr:gamma carbonic anhydrase family protein [Priestia megaterium]MQR86510.1 gamma carbonic anhydrase family protein [Priestia megaterium]